MLIKQLNKTNDTLKFEREARKEENKHKKDLEYFHIKFQEEVDAALMRVRQICSELQADFTLKETELLAKISNAERQIQQLNNISSNYRATRKELETTNRKQQEHLKSLRDNERSIQQLQADNTRLHEHIQTLTSSVNITSEENTNLRQKLETVKNQAKINLVEKERQLSNVLLRIEEQRSKHTEEVRQIQIQHQNSIKITSDANLREQKALENNTLLEGKMKMLEKTILEINDDHKHKQQELHTQLKNAQACEINLTTRLKEQNRELEQLSVLRTNRDSERRIFEEKIAEKELQLQHANEQLHNFIEETQNLKQELDQIKSKLSKLMGQKLIDENPNITDLSNKNRPTKLAERYSELYDKEWTAAFQDLNAIYKDEQKTIAMLTVILNEAACFCRNETDEQMKNLRKVLTLQTTLSISRGQDVTDAINQQLKNSRKVMSEIAETNIVETYIKRLTRLKRLKLLTSASARDALRVEKFLRAAFKLCWLMSIHDPPVVFDRLLKHEEEFNAELYQSYTQAGALVDFQVLPTMFLHEGGPVLYKGVAQGCRLTKE